MDRLVLLLVLTALALALGWLLSPWVIDLTGRRPRVELLV